MNVPVERDGASTGTVPLPGGGREREERGGVRVPVPVWIQDVGAVGVRSDIFAVRIVLGEIKGASGERDAPRSTDTCAWQECHMQKRRGIIPVSYYTDKDTGTLLVP